MADPLSIASGITAILTVTAQVVSICYKYNNAVKDASPDIEKLLHGLTSLMGVLTAVQAIVNQNPEECSVSTNSQLSYLKEPLDDCKNALDEIEIKLKKAYPDSRQRLARAAKLLSWPLKRTETLTLIQRLESHKTTFLCALTARNLSIGLQAQNVINDIQSSQERIERKIEGEDSGDGCSSIYHWLSPVDYRGAHRAACRLRLEGTGTWMMESSTWDAWFQAERAFLWLYGIPGSGKTVLISTLLEICLAQSNDRKRFVTYYYCDFREKSSQSSEHILGALICQLSKQLNEVPKKLIEFADAHRTDGGQYSSPIYEELESLFLSLLTGCPPIAVIVDALDECINRDNLLVFLKFLPTFDACSIKVLVSSRQEGDIQTVFAEEPQQSANIYAVDSDVRAYINASIAKSGRLQRLSPELRRTVKDSLYKGANGMFQWVQCQVKELSSLRTDRDIRMALNNLPQSLYDTYERILFGIKDIDRTIAKRALMWLAFSARPLTLAELAEAVIVNPGTLVIDPEARWNPVDLLSVIGSLVIYSEDSITLAHHSIKDYLLSTNLSTRCPGFTLSESTSNIETAETCLTYLLVQDFSHGACFQEYLPIEAHYKTLDKFWQRCKDYPLLRYASSYWPLHARKYLQSTPTLESLAYSLMNHTRTGNFWAWLECFVSQGYFGPRSLPRTLSPLYYAASLGLATIVSRLLESDVDINVPGGMYGGTPLHAAVFRGHLDVVEILLQAGASIEMKDYNGQSLIYFALYRTKKLDLVNLLYRFDLKQTIRDALEKRPSEFHISEGRLITCSKSRDYTTQFKEDTTCWTCCECRASNITEIAPRCSICTHDKCGACESI